MVEESLARPQHSPVSSDLARPGDEIQRIHPRFSSAVGIQKYWAGSWGLGVGLSLL